MKKDGQVRLMKVFQIQNNYQKHRKRLMSIQHINTKKKQHITTIRPSEASITYKQSKTKADNWANKTKTDKIQHQNLILLQKMEKQCFDSKEKRRTSQGNRPSTQSRRSLSSSRSGRAVDMENKRIYCRLQNVKSNYSKIRADKANKSANKLNDSKGQLFNLLVNQLGVKPSVLFPKVAKKKSIDHQIHKRKNSTSLSYPEKTLNVNLSTLANSFKVAKINQTHNPKVDRN